MIKGQAGWRRGGLWRCPMRAHSWDPCRVVSGKISNTPRKSPVQAITSAVYVGAQPGTDDDDENEANCNGHQSKENGQQNGKKSAASSQNAFNVDALVKRGKSKQPAAKKEPITNPKLPASKKGKKVCTHALGETSKAISLCAVAAETAAHRLLNMHVCCCSLATGTAPMLT